MIFETDTTKALALLSVSSACGAPQGRSSWFDPRDLFLTLEPMQMVDGDYSSDGTYWGCGNPEVGDMWTASAMQGDKLSTMVFVRATDMLDAIAKVGEWLGGEGHPCAHAIQFNTDGDRVRISSDVHVLAGSAMSQAMAASLLIPQYHPRIHKGFMDAVRFTEADRWREDSGVADAHAPEFSPEAKDRMFETFESVWLVLADAPWVLDFIVDGIDIPDPEQFGADLWLSMNGHGAGFFGRGREHVWQELHAMARALGGLDAHIGDDGLIYFD